MGMRKHYLFTFLFCLCWTTLKAEIVFNVADLSHSFDGFGAQIWPGDSRIETLSQSLNLKYYRIAPGGCTNPPTDATAAQMDVYVDSQYNGTNRGNSIIVSLQMAENLGVKVIFIKFGGCPDNWLTLPGTLNQLKSENFDDFARVWASEVLFFKSRGLPVDYIELLNEPEGTWNIKVPAADYNTLVKIVRAELDSRGLTDVGIVGPGLAYLYYGTSWIGALDAAGKNALAAWSTHAWDEGWGHTTALPSYLDQRWQDYFGAAVNLADPTHSKPIIVTEYASGVRTYNGVTYDTNTYGDTSQFAERCYENSLTLVNNGANVLCYWEAANQSWQDQPMYAFLRINSTLRPTYYVMSTLSPYIPDNAMVLTKTWNDPNISAAGFVGSGKLVLAFANSGATTINRTISVSGITSLSITSILAFQSGVVVNKTSDFSYDFEAGSMAISLPPESTLTIMADVNQCGAAAAGDLDNDCKITFTDFARVASDWMKDNHTLQTQIIEDFESYNDSLSLNNAWVVHTGGNPTTEILMEENGNHYLKMLYQVVSPYWAQTKFTLPGVVNGSHGVDWAYQGFTKLMFDYKITDVGSGNDRISVYDCWGNTVLTKSIPAAVTTGWITVNVDFVADLQPGANLQNVAVIGFAAQSTWFSAPTGDLCLDNIKVTNGQEVCLDAITGDVTGDCVVNFDDIDVLSENWLDCFLVEQAACW
jgi:hypothetical protein